MNASTPSIKVATKALRGPSTDFETLGRPWRLALGGALEGPGEDGVAFHKAWKESKPNDVLRQMVPPSTPPTSNCIIDKKCVAGITMTP